MFKKIAALFKKPEPVQPEAPYKVEPPVQVNDQITDAVTQSVTKAAKKPRKPRAKKQ
jgi:hypothetical protein